VNNQQKYRELLERCAAPPSDRSAGKWRTLLQILALPLCDADLVLWILVQGNWRIAADPIRYIRTAVQREQRKQEQPPKSFPLRISDLKLPRDEDGALMSHDDAIEFLASRSLEDSWETAYVEQRVRREFRGGERWDEDGEHTLNYSKLMDKVATEVGLTRVRRDVIEEVLCMRGSRGLTREQILACPPAQRRQRQAAWRWIDRNYSLFARPLSNRR
jgi:hypothetical protein